MSDFGLDGELPEVKVLPGDHPDALEGVVFENSGAPAAEDGEILGTMVTSDVEVPVRVFSRAQMFTALVSAGCVILGLRLADKESLVRQLLSRVTHLHDAHSRIAAESWARARVNANSLCSAKPLPSIGHAGDDFVTPSSVNEAWCQPAGNAATVNTRVDDVLLDLHRVRDAAQIMRNNRYDLGLSVREQTWAGRVIMTADEVIRGFEFMKTNVTCTDAGIPPSVQVRRVNTHARPTAARITTPVASPPPASPPRVVRLALPLRVPYQAAPSPLPVISQPRIVPSSTDDNPWGNLTESGGNWR